MAGPITTFQKDFPSMYIRPAQTSKPFTLPDWAKAEVKEKMGHGGREVFVGGAGDHPRGRGVRGGQPAAEHPAGPADGGEARSGHHRGLQILQPLPQTLWPVNTVLGSHFAGLLLGNGSLDFNFLGDIKVFFIKPPKNRTFCRGSTATKSGVGEFTTHVRTYFSGWIGMFTGGTGFWPMAKHPVRFQQFATLPPDKTWKT